LETVVIEFVEPPRWAAIADDVMRLFDEGKKLLEIMEELKCVKSWVWKARTWWYAQRGQVPPDARAMKSRLKQPPPPS
jgi:uncharacterized NAD(P)/FAD-binding protein YdhS